MPAAYPVPLRSRSLPRTPPIPQPVFLTNVLGYVLANRARGTSRRRLERASGLVHTDFEERSPSTEITNRGRLPWERGGGYAERGPRGQAEMIAPQAHIPAMKNLELTDDEAQALVRVIREAIDSDRFPLSPRIAVLRSILAQLRQEPARAPLPPLRNYVPPSKGRYRRRG